MTEQSGPGSAERRLEEFVASLRTGCDAITSPLDLAAASIFDALSAAGVDALLLKGAGLAHLLYRSGERRDYLDVDLLVSPAQISSAEQALGELGYRNDGTKHHLDEIGAATVHADSWIGSPHDPLAQIPVELHRWLPGASAPAAAVWQSLWSGRTSIQLDGREIPIPAPEAQAVQLAIHAAQHGPGYTKGLMELSLAIERLPAETWGKASALATEIGASDTFAAGLRLVRGGVELANELQLGGAHGSGPLTAQAYVRPRGTFHLRAFSEGAGTRERLAVLRRAIAPRRDWIAVSYPWSAGSRGRLALAYVLHLLSVPAWAARAWLYLRRVRRAHGPLR